MKEAIKQSYFIGVQSLPVVLMSGVFAGAVLSYVCYNYFNDLGVGSWTGAVTVKFLTWQIGPVLTAIVLSGRVGCAMAAEIGTMKITEQIDAIEAEGVDPVHYLIAPRFWAALLMTPIAVVLFIFVGGYAGLFMVVIVQGGESAYQWQHINEMIGGYDYVYAIVKGFVFGPTIALICCRTGLHATGGAGGVGQAATTGHVRSCMVVFVLNLIVTIVLNVVEPYWHEIVGMLRALF